MALCLLVELLETITKSCFLWMENKLRVSTGRQLLVPMSAELQQPHMTPLGFKAAKIIDGWKIISNRRCSMLSFLQSSYQSFSPKKTIMKSSNSWFCPHQSTLCSNRGLKNQENIQICENVSENLLKTSSKLFFFYNETSTIFGDDGWLINHLHTDVNHLLHEDHRARLLENSGQY